MLKIEVTIKQQKRRLSIFVKNLQHQHQDQFQEKEFTNETNLTNVKPEYQKQEHQKQEVNQC